MGDKISGSWATIGVLAEKGMPKVCSTGKSFSVWKIASLDTTTVSLFLFGDAYAQHYKESAGSIITVLNAKVRCDAKVRFFCSSMLNLLLMSFNLGYSTY
jgi:minichromosome maintenance protein 10